MRTELSGGTSVTERRTMDDESREPANGFLPAGVAQVPKEELQRYLKCKRIGNYLLGKTVGEGSFARVKQGFHVLTGEKVAIKIIDKKQAHQDKYVARNMRREAKIMQMIRHPNIVQLLEVVETEHRYYLVTELAAGGDLMDYICYRRKLGEVEVRKFIRQTVSAVHYLHQGGILHRDLKVENLLLDDDYNIKIIDFGLSNTMFVPSADGQTTREFLRTQCGSPAYAAPEILGHKSYGPEVDVWSIGVNMYAMLTGKLPYTAEPFHITTLYNKMKKNDMNPIPEHLSASCKDLIQRFLTFNREQRITLEEALGHEWLRKGYEGPVVPVLFPNYPRDEDLDRNIIRHLTDKMEFQQQEIIDAVTKNRSTSSSTVYHLLKRKLKKYYIKHPGKAERLLNAERIKGSSETVKNSKETVQEKDNENQVKKRPECTVPTAVVCDFNDKTVKTQKEEEKEDIKDIDSKKLTVPTCRKRLSSQSQENLSATSKEELSENIGIPKDDKDSEKFDSETNGVENDKTCSILSSAGIEISRKNSLNYSSVEVMAVKGRKLSLNLSHISVESKATADNESLKNTSTKNLDEQDGKEKKEAAENDEKESPRRVETRTNLTQEKTSKSPRHSVPNTPSIGKVSLINAKVISIPLQQTKQDSPDKVKFNHRRFSLPQSGYLPSRILGTNQHRQPVTSPFSITETRRGNKDSPALPPYGLYCQLTAIKAQDETDELASRAKEDKSRVGHAVQCNGLDDRHAQTRRNVYCSPTSTDKEQQRIKRHSVASSGGKELLKSINNTLGKLMEVQDKTEPVKHDGLLLRSRLPPATLNGPLKRESPVEGVKISPLQEHAPVDRVKERRNPGLKISCSVKDSHSHKPQELSSLNTESKSTKERTIKREKNTKEGQLERAARRRRRRTIENRLPITTDNDILSKQDESKSLRRHLRDDRSDTSHDSPRDGRRSRDSLEETV